VIGSQRISSSSGIKPVSGSGANMTDPKVTTIVLNRNNYTDTEKCIASLLEQEYKNISIIIIDNGSSDGSGRKLLLNFENVSNIEFILLKENNGFAEGNNIGIRKALEQGAEYVFLLNNDATVAPKCISTLIRIGESNARIGIVGAVNLYANDHARIWYSGGIMNWVRGRFVDETSNTRYDHGDRRIREVDYVPGSSMLVKKAVVEKAGLMWAPYFLCYEEADWCMRAKRFGFLVVAAMETFIHHTVHATMSKSVEYYYMKRNYPVFMLRNCPKVLMPQAIICYCVKMPVVYLGLLLRDKQRIAILWQAHVDFILHRYGEKRSSDLI
jgi:hypothetical protein